MPASSPPHSHLRSFQYEMSPTNSLHVGLINAVPIGPGFIVGRAHRSLLVGDQKACMGTPIRAGGRAAHNAGLIRGYGASCSCVV